MFRLFFFMIISLLSLQTMAEPVIVVLGDSISASYGMPVEQGWVSLLQKKLLTHHSRYSLYNASISGETSAGGLARIDALLNTQKPAIVLLQLGANDGLRGLPLTEMKANLAQIIEQSKKSGAKVLIIGMRIPPNYGPKYSQSFTQKYQQLSQEFKVPRVPFMLQGMENRLELIQDDGLHPNVQGQPIILENIWPQLKLILKK